MSKLNYIFGFHAIVSRLKQNYESIREIYLDEKRQDQRSRELLNHAEMRGIRIIRCDSARLTRITGTLQHQGVAASFTSNTREVNLEDILVNLHEAALFMVLDGVKDPHNLGACFRVAGALGAHGIIVPKDRSVGITPTVHKVASGAVDSVPFVTVTNLARTLRELKIHGIQIIGTIAETTEYISAVDLTVPSALVFGSEQKGLRRLTREQCDILASIPMVGSNINSLNISVAAGICLYETLKQRAIH